MKKLTTTRIKIFKKATALTLALLLAGLAGCGGYKNSAAGTAAAYDTGNMAAAETVTEECLTEAPGTSLSGSGTDVTASPSNQKMITIWNLSLQTEKYDEILKQLRSDLAGVGGYIESEYEYTGYNNRRTLSLTLRIPEAAADGFVTGAEGYGVITSRNVSQENVTLQYVDIESRIRVLRSEQTALLELMEKADTLENLLTIRSELTNVNYEIESYESQLRVLDDSINYSTIYLSIDEVTHEVPIEKTFGQEISETFRDSISGLIAFLRGFVVFVIGNSVIIAVIAAVIFAVIRIIKAIRRKHRKTAEKKQEDASDAGCTDHNSLSE